MYLAIGSTVVKAHEINGMLKRIYTLRIALYIISWYNISSKNHVASCFVHRD